MNRNYNLRNKSKAHTFKEILEAEKMNNIRRLEEKALVANRLAHSAGVTLRARRALFGVKQDALERAIAVGQELYRVSERRRDYIGVTRRGGVRLHMRRAVTRVRVSCWLANEVLRISRTRNKEAA